MKRGNITKQVLQTQYDGPAIVSQHNAICPQLSLTLTLAHTSDTFIYTPRHTRANGKVAGNISSEYMKQLHNTLDEIHSHHARGRENLKDYQHHIYVYILYKTSHLKQITDKQGLGPLSFCLPKIIIVT